METKHPVNETDEVVHAAIEKIDEGLTGLLQREVVSTSDVSDFLLEVRFILQCADSIV